MPATVLFHESKLKMRRRHSTNVDDPNRRQKSWQRDRERTRSIFLGKKNSTKKKGIFERIHTYTVRKDLCAATVHCSCPQYISLIVFSVRLVVSFLLLRRQTKFDSDFRFFRLESFFPLTVIFSPYFNVQSCNTYHWVYLWCISFCHEKCVFNFDFVGFLALCKKSQTHTSASWKATFFWP